MIQDKPLLVFDGVCNLCAHAIKPILWADQKHQKLFYATAQSDIGQEILAKYNYRLREYETVLLITPEGQLFEKSDVVLQVAKRLGGVWHLLRVFAIVPKSWRDRLYDYVAQRRYRWFGKSDYCERLPPKYLHRIIR